MINALNVRKVIIKRWNAAEIITMKALHFFSLRLVRVRRATGEGGSFRLTGTDEHGRAIDP